MFWRVVELEVPPFLISSISTTCNLHCKCCYARSNGIAEDEAARQKATLAPEQWQTIFTEAADMGINFSLIAGGEPFMRKDILEKIAEVKDMIFPIFTNGTLIGPSYIKFLKDHLNMVPIISIEGTAMGTDERRNAYADIIFLSFPGDEKALGGCLASGRGFFHIGPDGSAEPCPSHLSVTAT